MWLSFQKNIQTTSVHIRLKIWAHCSHGPVHRLVNYEDTKAFVDIHSKQNRQKYLAAI